MDYKKGYYTCNMVEPNNDQYEVYNGDGKVMIDHYAQPLSIRFQALPSLP